MSLQTYRKKRNFRRTAEPSGRLGRRSSHLYLVQKHAATRLHYDFRLAMNGVLKSWAVPKGPSLDPSDKRLAVHVEDHPLDYGSFEGTIPKGEYGGGTVMMWDRGEWEPLGDAEAGYAKGHLRFRLKGQRLRGRWALIRMGGRDPDDRNWLLVKEKDETSRRSAPATEEFTTSVITRRSMDEIATGSKRSWHSARRKPAPAAIQVPRGGRPAPFPADFKPQLATLASAVPPGDEWIHEVKYDGYRLLAFVRRGRVRLMTRNGLDWTSRFATVASALEKRRLPDAILDGEIVVQGADGRTDFQALQNALRNGNEATLLYYVFDLPYVSGRDITRTPLVERKKTLEKLLGGDGSADPVRYSGHIEGKGATVLRSACHYALEGILSKRADSAYVQERSPDWLKIKCNHRQEFVLGGYTKPKGSRQRFGSLLIGYYSRAGDLVYAGHVGTGFSAATLETLFRDMERRRRASSPFAMKIDDKLRRDVVWIDPELVAEVQFAGWTGEGLLRHPSFEGLREDKRARDVILERPAARHSAGRAAAPRSDGRDVVAGVTLSHPDRVLYPEQGLTKRDLCRYYEAVAEWMLPHLKGRPLSLVRCPQGKGKACFYQKHLNETAPDSLRGIEIEEKRKRDTYILVDDVTGLVSLAQLGVLEFHPWPAREPDIEKPDLLTFDLDPSPETSAGDLIAAARLVRDELADRGLTTFLKTTGGKGLHVVAPVRPASGWPELRAFAEDIATRISTREPERYVATMSKAKRKGKIFIDFFRNNRGSTSVSPYSTRAREGAPVAMPISWDELNPKLKPAGFNVRTALDRLRDRGEAWRGFFALRQSLPGDGRESERTNPAPRSRTGD